jgi:hypothetical protein
MSLRTYQDLEAGNIPQAKTLQKIVERSGLESETVLFMDPEVLAKADQSKKSRERLLLALIEKTLKLDDNALSVVAGFVETRYGPLDLKQVSNLENK